MHIVQILLPLYARHANRHERSAFDNVVHELNERFGGATLYARAPATGLWKELPARRNVMTSWYVKSWLKRLMRNGGQDIGTAWNRRSDRRSSWSGRMN